MLLAREVAPKGWLPCDGRKVGVHEYEHLFTVIGTRYGGDGTSTFGLPDLRGRLPMGVGDGPDLTPRRLGQRPGADSLRLELDNLPEHRHFANTTHRTATVEGSGVSTADRADVASGSMVQSEVAIMDTGEGRAIDTTPPVQVICWYIASFGSAPIPA